MAQTENIEVKLRGDASSFVKATEKAAHALKEVSGAIKDTAQGAAVAAAAILAVGTKLTSVAAKYDSGVKASVDRLSSAYAGLAVTVARAVTPVIDQMTAAVRKVSGAFDSLSGSEQQQVIQFFADLAKWGTLLGGGALIAGPLEKMFKILKDLAGAAVTLAPLAGTVLAVVAAIAGIVTILLVVHKAWRENWGGMQEKTNGFLSNLREGFVSTFEWILKVVNFFVSAQVRAFVGMIEFIEKGLSSIGVDTSPVTGFLKDVAKWTEHLTTKEGLKELVGDAVDTGKQIGKGLTSGLEALGDEAKIVLKELGVDVDALMRKYKGLTSARPGRLAGPTLEQSAKQREDMRAASASIHKSIVDAFKKQDIADQAALQKQREAREGAAASRSGQFLGKTGRAGDLVSAGATGFAAGGAGGAFASVAGELLTSSKTFTKIIEVVDGVIGDIADELGTLLAPALEVVVVVKDVVVVLLRALQPAFKLAADYLILILPLVKLFAVGLQAIAPALQLLTTLAAGPLRAYVTAASLVVKIVFEVFKFVGNLFITFLDKIKGVWNAFLSAVASILRFVGGFDLAGWKPFGFLNDWAQSIDGAKISTGSLAAAQGALNGLTWEAATATTAQVEATQEATSSVQEFSEQLTNTPSGFKLASYRFNASNQFEPGPVRGAAAGRQSAPVVTDNSVINVTVSGAAAPQDLAKAIADEVERENEKKMIRLYGTLSPSVPSRVRVSNRQRELGD